MSDTKKNGRNKVLLIAWGVLTIALLVSTGFQIVSNINNGDQNVRENLLASATLTMAQDESVNCEDIENIQVSKMKAGVFPFNYSVLVDMKNGSQLAVEWKDEDMSETEIVNQNR
ncbi:hypothetical protein MM221_11665 [Salipaludibacillus sp. LMS25]|jgi:hypothetical protein|uniref:hypothetical protein n=1 Tax=Salipaludibacillus sp. LMS25 TaxID=2924031 RepID=UPI0020D0C694|nr:hypothetical protein [Salipaludibacillus sp. LMS25]UTR13303.1 hypothetical protein MM221_11665 [Salipaludibacillus sp. LMS25]